MTPIHKIEDAKDLIESFEGEAKDFSLPISDEMIDPAGINIAIITDCILAKGWEPDGFEDKEGFKVFKYKDLE